MNTKYLMAASAILMGTAGISLLFLPDEIATYFGFESSGFNALPLQVMGALYFSFALLNWMAKGNIIGGIYSKPVAMGNFAYFFIAGLSIIKTAFAYQEILVLWIAGIIYAIFAILFAIVGFGNPIKPD